MGKTKELKAYYKAVGEIKGVEIKTWVPSPLTLLKEWFYSIELFQPAVVRRFKKLGRDGVRVVHVDNDSAFTRKLIKATRKRNFGLLWDGGLWWDGAIGVEFRYIEPGVDVYLTTTESKGKKRIEDAERYAKGEGDFMEDMPKGDRVSQVATNKEELEQAIRTIRKKNSLRK